MNRTVINKKAWSMLLSDEVVALGLQKVNNKSSWQAGEIMEKSHYKFLEITYRAQKFFQIFTEHIELFDEVCPDYIDCKPALRLYFNLCIENRMKPGKALQEINETYKIAIKKAELNDLIVSTLKNWNNPEKPHEFQVMNLVKDFDRWNNWRILPREAQEPSAFKRRIKNADKRRVKLFSTLHPLSIQKIKKIASLGRGYNKKYGTGFLPLLIKDKKITSFEILPCKTNDRTMELLTSIGLYVFTKEDDCLKYVQAVFKYAYKKDRECTDGLDFWPIYREQTKKAKNWANVQNITMTRKYLDLALKNLSFV